MTSLSFKLLPCTQIPLVNALQLPVRLLFVETISSSVLSIDMSEEPFQLFDLLVPDVVPHFENREVCPHFCLLPSVVLEPSADSSLTFPFQGPRHPYVDDVVTVFSRLMSKEDVYAT